MINRTIQQITVTAILLAGCLNHAVLADSTVGFAGVDARENTYYGYFGLRHHLSGELTDNGFLLRAVGFLGEYEYDTPAVIGGEVDADITNFDAMIGYQKAFENMFMRGYVGLDYENHDLSPNNIFDSNRGSDFGVKFLGELESSYLLPYYGGLIASYGTAKDRYWVRARGGWNFDGFIFGPEGLLTGDDEFDEHRIGAFLSVISLEKGLGLSISTGYSDSDDNRGGGSVYGTLELSATF
jgi:hypothetical protein